jgi:hypothetical protein
MFETDFTEPSVIHNSKLVKLCNYILKKHFFIVLSLCNNCEEY